MGFGKRQRLGQGAAAAIGISRERLEEAYAFLLANPPLGQAVQRHRDELRLVTAADVSRSVERYLGLDRPVALSKAALEVRSIIAYRQPITRAGVEFIRGSSDSALDSLLQRRLVEHNQHHLLVTTQAFLAYLGLRDLADLPPLPSGEQ